MCVLNIENDENLENLEFPLINHQMEKHSPNFHLIYVVYVAHETYFWAFLHHTKYKHRNSLIHKAEMSIRIVYLMPVKLYLDIEFTMSSVRKYKTLLLHPMCKRAERMLVILLKFTILLTSNSCIFINFNKKVLFLLSIYLKIHTQKLMEEKLFEASL